jgi:3-methylcrotonyl-CoA carboxylase beta subunit
MGGEQAAQTLLTVKREQLAAGGGKALTPAEEAAILDPIRAKYETEGRPEYGSARLWDDGVLDPARTRDALGLAFQATLGAPVPPPRFPVFRM